MVVVVQLVLMVMEEMIHIIVEMELVEVAVFIQMVIMVLNMMDKDIHF